MSVTSRDIMTFWDSAVSKCPLNDLFEQGVSTMLGNETTITFYEKFLDMKGTNIANLLLGCFDETDGDCEPLIDEIIDYLQENDKFSDENFRQIASHDFISSFVSGYRFDGEAVIDTHVEHDGLDF